MTDGWSSNVSPHSLKMRKNYIKRKTIINKINWLSFGFLLLSCDFLSISTSHNFLSKVFQCSESKSMRHLEMVSVLPGSKGRRRSRRRGVRMSPPCVLLHLLMLSSATVLAGRTQRGLRLPSTLSLVSNYSRHLQCTIKVCWVLINTIG